MAKLKDKAKNKAKTLKIGVIVSRFNEEITNGLLQGALAVLEEEGCNPNKKDIWFAPGAFELPLLAKIGLQSRKWDGVVCLGCVIKGDTAHFEYISESVCHGLMRVGLDFGRPVSFGVLTTYTEEQAIARSKADEHNKGREAASAVVVVLRQAR